jgi:hypothetical protein
MPVGKLHVRDPRDRASSGRVQFFWANYRMSPYQRVVDTPAVRIVVPTGYDRFFEMQTSEIVERGAERKIVSGASYQKRDPRSNQWRSSTREEYEAAERAALGS